ncbi:hypothetical protein B4N89_03240 [Embleya scabrispora]|uniref:Uncharacterized protein n=1 Tax=Embleya scabrispora TaxID=159449 RepID=A0A1T3NTL8_9ACTN|nr:hypothetical protein [Embleya scabrispora]OPC80095.1 hypothetical protein B4N89_03240 [Embleya scabrispora]
MPFADEEIYIGLLCGVGPDGGWQCWYDIRVPPEALRRLGLHPDQPSAEVTGPSPPRWWHAAAERHARGHGGW